MDAKFMRRYESFQRSLDSLAEAKDRDLSDSFVLSGTSAKFSITFDLAWKVMKDILVQYYAITGFISGSPREVLRQAYKAELISDDVWMEMLKVRNQLSHDYDGDIVKEFCGRIVNIYIERFYEFKDTVEKLKENFRSGE
ncbi:antitoxin [Lachnoclostridium sp. An169]|uniref:HI0074 family nucleotidyltransferase substrate-binding subunit n=1 Tax=Lachnoclostridium sp. An169 TaxID=1965569 RepID=UPI000B3A38FF|nr:HI0074 family nucleotidyltransferase substrate-binding subunit [Lachnoclostridium sp. An169]OUP83641.1 antitoxin [Lachnoclostridium sp. An169]HJA66666.1 nucleotidyltransferase substrate binding protein [Candidatus Mediterraneibacter cottocaccae]